MPLSPTSKRAVRRARGQSLGGGEVGFEGPQIAVVHADQSRLQRGGALQLGLVMHFDQHVHAAFDRGGFDLRHLPVVQRRDDDQDRIRADGARLSATCHGSTMKSLRSTGRSQLARASSR